uniref:Uncharacterized protein n=1 Tax=Ditylenchus dipsaci TaxID=166011 RepID=A0A915ED37_9BILA
MCYRKSLALALVLGSCPETLSSCSGSWFGAGALRVKSGAAHITGLKALPLSTKREKNRVTEAKFWTNKVTYFFIALIYFEASCLAYPILRQNVIFTETILSLSHNGGSINITKVAGPVFQNDLTKNTFYNALRLHVYTVLSVCTFCYFCKLLDWTLYILLDLYDLHNPIGLIITSEEIRNAAFPFFLFKRKEKICLHR